MSTITELKSIYAEYDKQIHEIAGSTSVLARTFNVGLNSRNHPCSQQFYDRVGEWAKAFAASRPSPQEIYEAVSYIFFADQSQANEDAKAYMQAAQAHTLELIPLLSTQDRAELREWYDTHFPRKMRLPIQEKIYKSLRK